MTKVEKFRVLIRVWERCTGCPLGFIAHRKALYRGNIDSKVVFVGEGPGKSEDILGDCFIGRAGKLLDRAIEDAGQQPAEAFFTNLVACRPCDGVGKPNRPPADKEVKACHERLELTLKIIAPRVVVWLGKVPQHFAQEYKTPQKVDFYMPHPAWILRCGGIDSKQYRDFVLKLKEVYKYAS